MEVTSEDCSGSFGNGRIATAHPEAAPLMYMISMLARCRAIDRSAVSARERTHAILHWMAEEPPTGSLSSAGPSDELASRENGNWWSRIVGAGCQDLVVQVGILDGMTDQETAAKTGCAPRHDQGMYSPRT